MEFCRRRQSCRKLVGEGGRVSDDQSMGKAVSILASSAVGGEMSSKKFLKIIDMKEYIW